MEVGGILASIRLNVEQGDIVGIAKFCRLLVGTVAIYQEDETAMWKELQDIPPFDWGKRCKSCAKGSPVSGCGGCEVNAFEDEMRRREVCLRILRKQNIFGYLGAPPLGNSDALAEALEEREDPVEA